MNQGVKWGSQNTPAEKKGIFSRQQNDTWKTYLQLRNVNKLSTTINICGEDKRNAIIMGKFVNFGGTMSQQWYLILREL